MSKDRVEKPSEGYFMAKREVAEVLMRRTLAMEEELKSPETDYAKAQILKAKIEAIEEARSFIRNFLLWDTRRGA